MTRKILIFFLLIFLFSLISCSDGNNTESLQTQNKQDRKDSMDTAYLPCKEDPERIKELENRKYKFPSIMVKGDMYSMCINGEDKRGIMGTLVMNDWEVVHDKYGRMCQYVSPEITYAELQTLLNYNDEDVVVNKEPKPDEPHAHIKTEWLTCNINYLDKVYDGKDKTVRLKAVVIDNKEQAAADAHAEYDEKTGFFRKILDLIFRPPH